MNLKLILKKILFLLSIILVAPFGVLYKATKSESIFLANGQLLSMIPGKLGSYLRVAYYKLTLIKSSRDWYIDFGSYFSHSEAQVGERVYIGAYCIIGMADLGAHSTIGSGVHILSGKHQHGYEEINKPIQEQKGSFKKIIIGENCWIGSGALIMANLGKQNVIGTGSVIVKETADYEVYVGNPATCMKKITNIK